MSQAPSLSYLVSDEAPAIYYEKEFKEVLEQHLPQFRALALGEHQLSTILEDNIALKCDGDFRKVCVEMRIPQHLQWLTLRINNLKNYADYKKTMKSILLVENDLLQRLRLIYSTTHQII